MKVDNIDFKHLDKVKSSYLKRLNYATKFNCISLLIFITDLNELIVKGDICIYDDWFSTGDLVIKKNKISSNDVSSVIYFLGRN